MWTLHDNCKDVIAASWNDVVIGCPIISLPQKVSDLIQNQQWSIPPFLEDFCPGITNLVQQIYLPVDPQPDVLVWKGTDNGSLTLKEAYDFKRHQFPILSWAKIIWCADVPPSRSILAWRIMLDKVPTDDKLLERGCNLPSMCSLCSSHSESMFHLFFQCSFAFGIWCWLATSLDLIIQFQSLEDIWSLCDIANSPQCKTVIKQRIFHLLLLVIFLFSKLS
ncbi:hypothetical protein QL285_069977 [Trifolium repens]|nr:hypothetical protein QL285_069977 [Trifolium repens]